MFFCIESFPCLWTWISLPFYLMNWGRLVLTPSLPFFWPFKQSISLQAQYHSCISPEKGQHAPFSVYIAAHRKILAKVLKNPFLLIWVVKSVTCFSSLHLYRERYLLHKVFLTKGDFFLSPIIKPTWSPLHLRINWYSHFEKLALVNLIILFSMWCLLYCKLRTIQESLRAGKYQL